MMTDKKRSLNEKIVKKLAHDLGIAESTIKKDISMLARKYPSCTINARAQIYAQKKGKTIFRFLEDEDKQSLPNIEVSKPTIKLTQKQSTRKREKILKLIDYESTDHFIKGHIEELNKCYTKGCYTATFILCRKIVENLIIDILQKKFPPSSLENKELYFSTGQKRFKDFDVILENLGKVKSSFDTKQSIVERLIEKASNLKGDANKKTHSWYHLVKIKKEIDDLDVQSIIELIKKLS